VDIVNRRVDLPEAERPEPDGSLVDRGNPTAGRVKASKPAGRGAYRDEWHLLTAQFHDHNYRHSWEFAAAVATRWNASVENLVITSDGRVAGLASVRIKPVPGLGTGIAYVSGGPLVRQSGGGSSRLRLEIALDALKREYVDRRRLLLRVAPSIGDPDWCSVQEQCFGAMGFTPAADHVRPYKTMLLDLNRPSEEVRAGIARRWRRNLNKAEREDIHVEEGCTPDLFEEFRHLFKELVARKSFAGELGADFFAGLQADLVEGERLHVSIAWVDGVPAAGLVVSILGDTAVFLLGASNDVGRAANAAYLLHWNAIKAASERGCRWYDLGGIDADRNPGGYQFKSGMGGIELSAPGPYEVAPGRLRGGAVRTAERLFKAVRSLHT
jgi:lipid II:glycine glycyltransferase (peptidoglycan interpeptide bridge formation enzyme)